MTSWRLVFLLVFFGAIALCLLHLRSGQRQAEVRILTLDAEGVALREESWELQMEIARLKTPGQLFHRVERLDLPLTTPAWMPEDD